MDRRQRSDLPDTATARFASIVDTSEADLNLAEAALSVALDEYPDLDVARYLGRLDEIAARVRSRLPASFDAVDAIRAMNAYLFVEQDFTGNVEDYADPRNSYLNDVLDRRLGIPITLSILYIETGWRLGVPFEGVSFPGHFLVKCAHGGGEIVLDPFFKGMSLGEDDVLERARQVLGERLPASDYLPLLLAPASKREILARMLRNLKTIFLEAARYERALGVMHRMIALAPGEAPEVRDRGDVYYSLDCFRPALADYEHYLELAPDADDAGEVRGRVIELHHAVARLN